MPFDFARFKVAPRSIAPITTLPGQQLMTELAEEYVFAEMCEQLMLSFSAERRFGAEERTRTSTRLPGLAHGRVNPIDPITQNRSCRLPQWSEVNRVGSIGRTDSHNLAHTTAWTPSAAVSGHHAQRISSQSPAVYRD